MLVSLTVQILTFAIVVGATILGSRALEQYLAVRRRLGAETTIRSSSSAPVVKTETVNNRFLLWVQSASLSDSKERTKLRESLSLAGLEHPAAPAVYVVVRFLLAIGLPLAFLFMQSLSHKPMSGPLATFIPLILAGVGLIAPKAIVDNRANARRAQMEREFPDALDLLVVCVEAGLGVEAAFIRVGQEMRTSHPMVSESFGRLASELAAGRGRADALRSMAERAGVDSVKSFAALLIQTEALGVSIGQTLRTFSVEMRETRFLKAEEKAMRIPVLMTVPLTACILPVIVAALLLPAVLQVIRTVGPALTGHH